MQVLTHRKPMPLLCIQWSSCSFVEDVLLEVWQSKYVLVSISELLYSWNIFPHAFLCLGFAGGFPGAMPGGMPGMAGMPGLNEILSDPEVLAAMQVSIWLKSKLNALNEGGTASVSWGKMWPSGERWGVLAYFCCEIVFPCMCGTKLSGIC